MLRADSPQGFLAGGVCVEADEGADTIATDLDEPLSEQVFYYLIRAENPCGAGSLGAGAAGERSGLDCAP